MRTFRIAMVQMNPTVGDLDGNVRRIIGWLHEARKARPDLVTFPELAITGNPPEDLLLKPQFVEDNRHALAAVVRACRDLVAVVGYVGQGDHVGLRASRHMVVTAQRHELYNAAALVADCRLAGSYCKWFLTNCGVFDETRYFHPGARLPVAIVNGTTIGVNISEDIWSPEGPIRMQAVLGAEVIVNVNSSPFEAGKSRSKEQMLATRARENGVIVTYTNAVGGQDELVFDGNSVILDQAGSVIARAKAFQEDLLVADLNVEAVARGRMVPGRKKILSGTAASVVDRVTVKTRRPKAARARLCPSLVQPLEEIEEIYQALVMGVKDYVRKNGFKRVVLGMSGGVDSALTAAIAADALGPDNVLGVFMPSLYTSHESGEDVSEMARRLRIELKSMTITPVLEIYRKSLRSLVSGSRLDSTEENLQARIRGNILMALSNKFG